MKALLLRAAQGYRVDFRPEQLQVYAETLESYSTDAIRHVLDRLPHIWPSRYPTVGEICQAVVAAEKSLRAPLLAAPETRNVHEDELDPENPWAKLAQCWESCPPTQKPDEKQWENESSIRETLNLPLNANQRELIDRCVRGGSSRRIPTRG